MIHLVGVDHRISIDIREKFSIISKRIEEKLELMKNLFDEVVLISTCNRTEVYVKSEDGYDLIMNKLFSALSWDISLREYLYYKKDEDVVRHIMNLSCGFYSIVKGEEQILSQVKSAYDIALEARTVKGEFTRLFRKAIRCGKEFRHKSNLHRIPVSSSSIAINEARSRNLKRFMIIGYGEVGILTKKYILASEFEKVYIVVRDKDKRQDEDPRIEYIDFKRKEEYYKDVDCIISSTSAPHTVIKKDNALYGKLIFDLAVPRDVEESLYKSKDTEVYGIDRIRDIDSENQKKRDRVMEENRYIVEKYIEEFKDWKAVEELTPIIIDMKAKAKRISAERVESFKNKKDSKDIDELAKILIQSSANAYTNRAIEVLKEETKEGRRDQCLEIIKKIFC